MVSHDQCYLGTVWLHVAGSCCQEIVLHSLNSAHSFQTSGKNIMHTYDSVTCVETVTTINTQYVSAVLWFVPPASLLSSDVILLISICTCICGRVATGSYVRLSKRGFHYRVLLICVAVCQVQWWHWASHQPSQVLVYLWLLIGLLYFPLLLHGVFKGEMHSIQSN